MLLNYSREKDRRASSQSLDKTDACLLRREGYSDTPTTLDKVITNCQ